jgi:ADP-ribosyl-[dinitrogen reductase] hydrolase
MDDENLRLTHVDLKDRLLGVLIGTALGDALGLPMEGMPADAIARDYPQLDRYHLLGVTGYVSDDTEQTALVAQCLARSPEQLDSFIASFRKALLAWFLRLPWGIGLGTLRACVKIGLGLSRSGVASAGNGAAMRSAIVGAFFFDSPELRRNWSQTLARTTHTDSRAVEGAQFVAEIAALATRQVSFASLDEAHARRARIDLVAKARTIVYDAELGAALDRSLSLARGEVCILAAAEKLGCSGFVVHTLALATFAFLRFGSNPKVALTSVIRAGGDTDSNAAILGAWMGALHGARKLPQELAINLYDGCFQRAKVSALASPSHMRALAEDLVATKQIGGLARARYSWPGALLRNLLLYPVVLLHAARVLIRR